MWLRGQECFEEPPAIVDLADVAKLCKQCNTLVHDGDFARSVVDLLYADGVSIAYVDQAGVVFNWDKLPLVVKNGPVLLQQFISLITNGGVEVQKVELLLASLYCDRKPGSILSIDGAGCLRRQRMGPPLRL